MQQHFWQYLSVHTIVGWLIVSFVPAVLLFWGYIIADNIQLAQVHSVIASSSAVVLSIIGLERLTQFPWAEVYGNRTADITKCWFNSGTDTADLSFTLFSLLSIY